jgi:hypothetical protein
VQIKAQSFVNDIVHHFGIVVSSSFFLSTKGVSATDINISTALSQKRKDMLNNQIEIQSTVEMTIAQHNHADDSVTFRTLLTFWESISIKPATSLPSLSTTGRGLKASEHISSPDQRHRKIIMVESYVVG